MRLSKLLDYLVMGDQAFMQEKVREYLVEELKMRNKVSFFIVERHFIFRKLYFTSAELWDNEVYVVKFYTVKQPHRRDYIYIAAFPLETYRFKSLEEFKKWLAKLKVAVTDWFK
jgi:hypothetical protein